VTLSDLLEQALRALPGDATHREIGLVAKTLIQSGDEETLGLLKRALEDKEVSKALDQEAAALGSSQFVTLELEFLTKWVREGVLPLDAIEDGMRMDRLRG
jgi:hypothetical protein